MPLWDNQTSVEQTSALLNLLAAFSANATVETLAAQQQRVLAQAVQQRIDELLSALSSNITTLLKSTANGTFSTTKITEANPGPEGM